MEYASRGVGNAGLATGIIGTALVELEMSLEEEQEVNRISRSQGTKQT